MDGSFSAKRTVAPPKKARAKSVAAKNLAVFTRQFSVMIDEPRSVPVRMFTPRNSWNYDGEMIHAATVAVVGEVPLDRLWHAVPSYPTMSEVWLRLLEELGL